MKHPSPNTFDSACQRMAGIALLLLLLGMAQPAWAALVVNAGNGTVTDSTTSLVWDQCPYGMTGATCATGTALQGTWAQALDAAVAANTASYKGFTDWRVPNKNELESIAKIDTYTAGQPSIDATAFPGTPLDNFWTSSTYAPVPSFAWIVLFNDGFTGANDKTHTDYVRLVRSGQSFASFDVFAPASQTITGFSPASPVVFGAAPATLSATGGASGNAIVYATTSAASICTVSGTTVTFTGVGTCNLTANQGGNASFSAAPQATASIVITAAPVTTPTPTPDPSVALLSMSPNCGLVSWPSIVNMANGEGPAFTVDLVALLANAIGQPLVFVQQDACGSVTLSGYNGGKLAFVPHSYQGSGDPRANGVYPLGDGRYQIVRNGQSLVIAPTLVGLDQLLALLPGVSARQADNGVLIATYNGLTYAVQPGVAVQLNTATGGAQLSMGGDGYWHFIDAQGNNQVLYPAFADVTALRNALWGLLDYTATLSVQLDGTASIVFNGQRYTLVPDLTLTGMPTERVGQNAWQEGAARYRVTNYQPLGTAQGLTVKQP